MAGLFAFIIVAALVIPAIIVRGFVLSILWGWFIVPTFDVAPLGIPAALGVSLVAAILINTTNHQSKESSDIADSVGNMIGMLIAPFVSLLMGYVILQFM